MANWSQSDAISGWKQPFYILAETKSPRKYLPKYTVIAWGIATVLYMLVNISYLLVVDKSLVLPQTPNGPPGSIDLVTLFFLHLFGQDNDKAARAMAGVIAFSIFGSLWVMTFTASRIKQEIAKEGILPKSLHIAASYTTPYVLAKKWFLKRSIPEGEVEEAPTLAFALHWLSSIVLVALVSPISDARLSYFLLVTIYAYSINTLVGCAVASGLLMIKLRKSKWHWQERRRYRPWLSPVHAIIYAIATAFIAITVFIPPTEGSPFTKSNNGGLPYYLAPLIGVTAPLWGLLWYCGLCFYGWYAGRQLNVTREAYWTPDPNCPSEYVQQAEIIDVAWQITPRDDMSEDFTSLVDLKSSSVVRQRAIPGNDSCRTLEASRDGSRKGDGPVSSSRRLSDSFDD
jgi:amino acid transporter